MSDHPHQGLPRCRTGARATELASVSSPIILGSSFRHPRASVSADPGIHLGLSPSSSGVTASTAPCEDPGISRTHWCKPKICVRPPHPVRGRRSCTHVLLGLLFRHPRARSAATQTRGSHEYLGFKPPPREKEVSSKICVRPPGQARGRRKCVPYDRHPRARSAATQTRGSHAGRGFIPKVPGSGVLPHGHLKGRQTLGWITPGVSRPSLFKPRGFIFLRFRYPEGLIFLQS
jgi:hypothetical protein